MVQELAETDVIRIVEDSRWRAVNRDLSAFHEYKPRAH
jgi:hypothetical protein